jgi:hypothetical protein
MIDSMCSGAPATLPAPWIMAGHLLHEGGDIMKKFLAPASIPVLFAIAVTACSSATGQATPQPDAPKKNAPVATSLSSITEAVLADAAAQTGVAKSALTVASAEEVLWADGSLGCPAPGSSYTMAQVPGYRVRVRAGERELDYHANRRGYFMLCPSGRAADPVGPVAY